MKSDGETRDRVTKVTRQTKAWNDCAEEDVNMKQEEKKTTWQASLKKSFKARYSLKTDIKPTKVKPQGFMISPCEDFLKVVKQHSVTTTKKSDLSSKHFDFSFHLDSKKKDEFKDLQEYFHEITPVVDRGVLLRSLWTRTKRHERNLRGTLTLFTCWILSEKALMSYQENSESLQCTIDWTLAQKKLARL